LSSLSIKEKQTWVIEEAKTRVKGKNRRRPNIAPRRSGDLTEKGSVKASRLRTVYRYVNIAAGSNLDFWTNRTSS
jgi:hypothetical protein